DRVADRINNYREEHAILDRLAGTRDAFIESEHTTGQTQPSQTVKNLAQAHNEGHRCLLVCRPDDAANIYDTLVGGEPCCRSKHSVEGEKRFYTFTRNLNIDGQKITRPGSSDNVWVYDKNTGQYVLRDNDGTEHARFDTAADIFNDASAEPAGGERNIKAPAITEHVFTGDYPVTEVEWDIITVPTAERDEDGEKIPLSPADLELYRDDEANIPLSDMLIGAHETEGVEAPTADAQDESELSASAESSG